MILVESYADESQYRGTCYRACGFEAVGLTAGFGRSSRDYYLEHGKCLRGSARTDGKPLQLLSAVSHRLRLTVAQEPIQEQSNEIPAIKPLLNQLPKAALEGCMITADALHCQQETTRFITQQLGADYLFGLKGNQSGILERAQIKLPKDFFPSEYDTGWSKEHGHPEKPALGAL